MEDISIRDKEVVHRVMVAMLKHYNNDFVAVMAALESVTSIVEKPPSESSAEELEKVIGVIFNTREVQYKHLIMFVELLCQSDSPILVGMLVKTLSERKSAKSPEFDENPFLKSQNLM